MSKLFYVVCFLGLVTFLLNAVTYIIIECINFITSLFKSKKKNDKQVEIDTLNSLENFIIRNKNNKHFLNLLKKHYYIKEKPEIGDNVTVSKSSWSGKNGYVTKLNDEDNSVNIRVPKYLNFGKVPRKIIKKKTDEFKLT